MNKLYITILMLMFSTLAWSTIINVPDDYPTIQEGINASVDGDTVILAVGSYNEHINFNSKAIVFSSRYLFLFDEYYRLSTIIQGDMSDESLVKFESGEDRNSILYGLTISSGRSMYGGAICCRNSSPTISACVITSNEAIGFGGAIFAENGSPEISNNYFLGNHAIDCGGAIYCLNCDAEISENEFTSNSADENGGGMYLWYSNPVLDGNTFLYNEAGDRGGVAYLWFSNPRITDNIMQQNQAQRYGGALYIYASAPVIFRNTFKNNSSIERGGAIFAWYADPIIKNNLITANSSTLCGGIYIGNLSDAEIINNTIVSNSAERGGGFYSWGCDPLLINNIFWYNQAEIGPQIEQGTDTNPIVRYCNVEGGYEGEGNLDMEPMFRDTSLADYHLMDVNCGDPDNSPCIDAGDPDIVDDSLDCDWGLGALFSDMGAYGGGSINVGIEENNLEDMLPDRVGIVTNYPNPFNNSTVISFNLVQSDDIELSIYNILGRKVENLLSGKYVAGRHSVVWNAAGRASGMYFVRLTTISGASSSPIILLK